jgi:thiol:disulfide interchange protein DsbD
LFTLLMPCTYPMIPITISYFTKQAAQRKTGTLPLSLAYGIGIVLIFVLIGVVVGPLIIRFATHPVTNLIIGGFFLLFALALFGIVDLQPPRFLLSAAGKASSQGGFFGVFLMGATLVVTSFTCTAPFVGTLLSTGASSGDLGRVALGMGVFGATMAIPFVFLSMVPGKVQALPRSGEWMHVLKVTLGFVEIAAALKFISNVDLVWQWGFLTRELFLVLWLGIFLVAALYLFGQIRLKGESTSEISPGRMVAGLFFSLFALYCGYGAFGNPMDPIMTAIIPNYSGRIASAGDRSGPPVAAHTIVKDDYEGALAQAKSEGKLLLVNFTGFT